MPAIVRREMPRARSIGVRSARSSRSRATAEWIRVASRHLMTPGHVGGARSRDGHAGRQTWHGVDEVVGRVSRPSRSRDRAMAGVSVRRSHLVGFGLT